MSINVDQAVLLGFIEEAESYLPTIRQSLATFAANPTALDSLEAAHRHVHTIKGAAAMVGLPDLSQIADAMEAKLVELGAGELAPDKATLLWLHEKTEQLATYLDGLKAGDSGDPAPDDEPPVIEEAEPPPTFDVAAIAAAAPASDDSLDMELLDAFQMEAEEHIGIMGLALTALMQNPADQARLQDVRRSAHTLKGAAATIGLRTIAELTHRMEDLLDLLYEQHHTLTEDMMTMLFASVDLLEDITRGTLDSDAAQPQLEELYQGYDLLFAQLPTASAEIPTSDAPPSQNGHAPPEPSEPAEPARQDTGDVIRVPIERLDALVRLVSELVIARTSLEQRMGDFAREVNELTPSIERLRQASLRLETEYEVSTLAGRAQHLLPTQPPLTTSQAHEFDALEFDRYTEFHRLTRELSETTSDVNTVGNALQTLIGDFDSMITRQGRLASELQEKLIRTRMMPLSTLAARLHRAVRVVAQERGKAVALRLVGDQTELDKTVLEDIADPLLHLLRNAVDHGIESPAIRQRLGKPEQGSIELHAFHEGNQVVIQVRDDGAGLDSEAIRAKAIRNGLISEAEAVDEAALYALVFTPGFSTASEISEISGRGIGLDVVRENVHQLKGSITLDSTVGEGATFTIRLPMTLAVTQALLVKARGETFAIPLGAVNQILRLSADEIDSVGGEPVVRVGKQVYPLLYLSDLLTLKQPPDVSVTRYPILVVNAGDKQIALAVEQLVQGREIVIKTLGTHLKRVHGITGATLMGDGSVVLILNPAELVSQPAPTMLPVRTPSHIAPALESHTWNILVVDDSVSVRRVVSDLVKNAGWRPIPARDGLEALETIQQMPNRPDLILLDIEMPRMDGYELTSTLRNQAAYRDLPIVMMTSRAGEKHRRKAFEMGVSEYVVKPYQDEMLLNIIRRLIATQA